MHTLKDWIAKTRSAIERNPKAKIYRLPKGDDLYDVIEVGYNRKSNITTASISIYCDRFEELLYGKLPRTRRGGVIVVAAGMANEPYLSAILPSSEGSRPAEFAAIIARDAEKVFRTLQSLTDVYEELTSASPRFKYVSDPSRPYKSELYAAIVAFLVGYPWLRHIEFAASSPFEKSTQWAASVRRRLEESCQQ